MKERWIWFDMDGTIADFYGVEGWLEDIKAERVRPYAEAKPKGNAQVIARALNRKIREGWHVGIISWMARGGSAEYGERVAEAKRAWIRKHFASVKFERVDVVPWGEPKHIGRAGILFDDEKPNRDAWGEGAHDVHQIAKDIREA